MARTATIVCKPPAGKHTAWPCAAQGSSKKLDEFREIVHELAIEEGRKVVVFSEYERMTHLAGEELAKLGIGFVSLHGGVPSRNRGALMEKDTIEMRVWETLKLKKSLFAGVFDSPTGEVSFAKLGRKSVLQTDRKSVV